MGGKVILKKRIREEFLKKRRKQPYKDIVEKSNKIFSKILETKEYKKAKNILVYLSLKDEVSTEKLIVEMILKKKNVYAPKINIKKDLMDAIKITEKTSFFENKIGIYEPVDGEKAKKSDIDLIIIPAIAFDYWGHRIGFGNGCYDRFLTNMTAFKLGVGFDFQIIESIPAEEHDIKVDMIITEKRIIRYDLDD